MLSLRGALSRMQHIPRKRMLVLLVLLALLGYLFGPTLQTVLAAWTTDPHSSHGYVVPVLALVLLWLRREQLARCQPGGSWWGVALFLLGGLIRVLGALLASDWLEAAALLPILAGLAVLLGGWPALRWSWPAIALLLFMIPLSSRVAFALSGPCASSPRKGAPTCWKRWVCRLSPRRTSSFCPTT
jgi:hypothetical protein